MAIYRTVNGKRTREKKRMEKIWGPLRESSTEWSMIEFKSLSRDFSANWPGATNSCSATLPFYPDHCIEFTYYEFVFMAFPENKG